MSRRNTLENKRLRREAKKQREQLSAYIDLIEWIKMRSSVTTNTAVKLLFAGVLRADSHKLGFTLNKNKSQVLQRYVPAELRGRIEIHSPRKETDAS